MKWILLLLLVFSIDSLYALPIIPYPNSVEIRQGVLNIPRQVTIHSQDAGFEHVVPVVRQMAKKYFQLNLKSTRSKGFIYLLRDPNLAGTEQYTLEVLPGGIQISAGSSKGCFYGLQSALQLLYGYQSEGKLPLCLIRDEPRYGWRGLMLDESRQFYGMDEVKQVLDFMSMHKLNVFHWHLTDDSGWRIEIKKYPLLTTVGGIGNATDPKAPAKFYTQKQIREIVQYAAQRFITIIPEVDMPGHASAAIRAYPQYSGGGSPQNPDFTFNPGLPDTYTFLTDVLKEVAGLFPSKYLHVGADEVHFGNQRWPELPQVKQLMQENQMKTLLEVEHYFLNRMQDSLQKMGNKMIAWDEAVAAGLPAQQTLIMWWRHNRPQVLQDALAKGYQVVLCPRIPMYFDFVQYSEHLYGRKWDTLYVSLERVYNFPSKEDIAGVDPSHSLLAGIQANVWTPDMHTRERLQFMLYPRLSALAEAGWTTTGNKEFKDFTNRLQYMFKVYSKQGVRYFDEQTPPYHVEEPGPRPKKQDEKD